jgi:hypothetical protein
LKKTHSEPSLTTRVEADERRIFELGIVPTAVVQAALPAQPCLARRDPVRKSPTPKIAAHPG